MSPIEVSYSDDVPMGTLIGPLTIEVGGNATSVVINCPRQGTIRLTEQGWDALVRQVNEAFVGEPVADEEEEPTYGASEEMRQALSELPVENYETYRCKACNSYYKGIHFPACPMYKPPDDNRDRCWECGRLEEDTCSNCEQYPREGHDPNCTAEPS